MDMETRCPTRLTGANVQPLLVTTKTLASISISSSLSLTLLFRCSLSVLSEERSHTGILLSSSSILKLFAFLALNYFLMIFIFVCDCKLLSFPITEN